VPRVAIDYTPAYEQGGGIGRYVRELVNALARHDATTDYRLFVSGTGKKPLPPLPGSNFVWKPTAIHPLWLARMWHRAQLPLPIQVFTGQADLYHATDFVLPPTLPGTPTLLTVHDLSFVRVPDAASPNLKAYLDSVVPRSVQRATHVLADSQATKEDLIRLYDTSPEKITVLLSGVDSRFKRVENTEALKSVRAKYKIPPRPYVISVGTVQPRKNYPRLIQALARLRAQGHDIGLVIAGGKGWLEDPIHDAIRETNTGDSVHMIGFADDIDLPTLYSAADCLAFPSLYEGFGLPILEAMACGTPVVTSNVSSLPEVAGDAAICIDPHELDVLTDAIGGLLTDARLRASLIERGYARAAAFTWDAAAEQLLAVYNRMMH
jgi:glycosyltransferase involved in cell wall biosynthesis